MKVQNILSVIKTLCVSTQQMLDTSEHNYIINTLERMMKTMNNFRQGDEYLADIQTEDLPNASPQYLCLDSFMKS
jgi:hypothetical protein